MKSLPLLLGALIVPALLAVSVHAEKVTYLGVATVPVNPVAAYQLNLPEGVGLAVVQVAGDGMVKDKLVANDILHKLDDQILTSPEQLAVLVRSHKPGDAITLTAIRKGKAEVLQVRLGETEAHNVAVPAYHYGWPMGDEELQQRMEQLQRHRQNGWQPNDANADEPSPAPCSPRPHNVKESHSNSVITETRDGLTVTLTNRDGAKTVTAEENGKVIVEHQAMNTAEQLKALPEKVRDRVNKLQKQYEEELTPTPMPHGRGPNIAL